jgi:hypothetical protein
MVSPHLSKAAEPIQATNIRSKIMADVKVTQDGELQTGPRNGSSPDETIRGKQVKNPKRKAVAKPERARSKDKKGRRRGRKPYPIAVVEEALSIPKGIMQYAVGNPVRRLRLTELMDLNPAGDATREMINLSNRYGLVEGTYKAEELRLTEKGKQVVDPTTPPRQRRQASFDVAIADIEPFKRL